MTSKNNDIQRLQSTINEMDSLSQYGFSQISALSRMTIRALESGTYNNPIDDVIEVLKVIWNKAEDIENCVNGEAENVGCNHTSQRLQNEINEAVKITKEAQP